MLMMAAIVNIDAQPTITSFTPAITSVGSTVTITGANFNTTAAQDKVYFGPVSATPSVASSTSLTVTVPVGASYNSLSVTDLSTKLTRTTTLPFLPSWSGTGNTAFTSSSVSTGAGPTICAIADIDGDGKPDVAIANQLANTISVFRNTSNTGGNINLTAIAGNPLTLSATASPIALGDLDGDGKPDLVAADYTNNLFYVYRNTSSSGSISFATPFTVSYGGSPNNFQHVVLADMNGDGKLDIISCGLNSNNFKVFKNTYSSGTLAASDFSSVTNVNLPSGGIPNAATVADLDGDGLPEVMVADFGHHNILVYHNTSNTSTISFSYSYTTSAPNGSFNPFIVTVADLDGDGKLDMIAGGQQDQNVYIYRNTSSGVGNINFDGAISFNSGNGTVYPAFADIYGHGMPDMIVSNSLSNNISCFKNTSTGAGNISFGSATYLSTGTLPWGIYAGDLNADNKPDIITCNTNSNTLSVLKNTTTAGNITPTFTSSSPQTLTVCENASAVSINSLLTVNDADASQTETWSVTTSPTHGTLGGFNTTASSGSTSITPSGLTYTPANGYTGSDHFTVQISDGSATSSMTVNVTVNPLPTPTISGLASVCANSTGNVYTTESGMTAYNWNIVGGTITAGSTTNTATITWTSVGTGTISVNYNNSNGCTSVIATVKNVTVNPLPVPTISGSSSVCANSTGNVYTTESGMTAYNWSINGGTITAGSSTNTPTVTWTSTGARTISVNYTNGNSCTAASVTVKNVTVNPLPVPTITGSALGCINTTGNIYTTEAGMSNYTWNITGGNITAGSTTNTITVTWNTLGSQSLSVNYSDGNTCTAASATVKNVTVNPLPVPTISGPASVCLNVTGNTYSTESGMTNYTWNITGGVITAGSTTNTITVTWNTLGAQSLSVNYTNVNTCTAASATVYNVTVHTLPVPTINGPTSMCSSASGNVFTTESGKSNYIWAVPGGTITAGSATNSITATLIASGAQTVSVNYADANGCTAATPTLYNVTVNGHTPVITGLPDNNYVVPKLATYQYSTPLIAGDLYSWSSPKIEGYCSASAKNCVNVHFLDPCCVYGQWSINVTETNPATGCSATTTKLIYITP